ncbi:tripartite tricarboxylate transporter TctB family protein [Terrihabitans sp. B22-R8]|uniref:tripartite tricarboxylate transporter TctB family protein n=1 Tax=Terrihabitans sp. B22-R8 TaxID=3425128 RepID=UPI00403CF47F
MQRKGDLPDILFGGFLILVAAGTMFATRNLTVGRAGDMGPGYMPLAISLILLGFGLVFAGRGFFRLNRGIEPVQPRPVLGIMLAVGMFALLAESAGLVLASLATIIVAGFAGRENRLIESLIFSVVLTAAAVLLFVKGLALPVPVWPW